MATEREERIVRLLEQHHYLERNMIQQKLFRFKTGKFKTRQVLTKMCRRGQVNRFRNGPREDYIYHLDQRSQKWRHWLDVNRFHFALLRDLRGWQSIQYHDFEVSYPYGQADGFYIVKLTLQDDCLMFYLEMDDGKNKFDKVKKYMNYEKSGKWKSEWWGRVFPLVVIATCRVEEIGELVRRCGAGKYFRVVAKGAYRELVRQIKGA